MRAGYEFALSAIDAGAGTVSELGRALGVSEQAAAETLAALERMGYARREADPAHARRQLVRVTERGHEMVAIGAALFDEVRERWAERIGVRALTAVEEHLARLVRPGAAGRAGS